MYWAEVIKHYTDNIQGTSATQQSLTQLLNFIDLTSLNESDSEKTMLQLSENAITDMGHVAAVCVYPRFVPMLVKKFENTPVKVATVVNFPDGQQSKEAVLKEIVQVIGDGAQEVDVVLPYRNYLAGDREMVQTFISACKLVCGSHVLLKVILETGALKEPEIIANASIDAIRAGADFLKTSTGKIEQGATLEAVTIILMTIKRLQASLSRQTGIKISGGVRHIAQAQQYVELAKKVMGETWVTPDTFRIGASQLVNEILNAEKK